MDGLKQSLEKAIEELRERQPVTSTAPAPDPDSIEAALLSAPSVSPNYVPPRAATPPQHPAPEPKPAATAPAPQQGADDAVAGDQASLLDDMPLQQPPEKPDSPQPPQASKSAGNAQVPPNPQNPPFLRTLAGPSPETAPQPSSRAQPPMRQQEAPAADVARASSATAGGTTPPTGPAEAVSWSPAQTPPMNHAANGGAPPGQVEPPRPPASGSVNPGDLKSRMTELMEREFTQARETEQLAESLPKPDKLGFNLADLDGDGKVDLQDAKVARDRIWRWITVGVSCAGGLASGWVGSSISDQAGLFGKQASSEIARQVGEKLGQSEAPGSMSGGIPLGKTDRATPVDERHCTVLELDRGAGLVLAKPCKPVETGEINSQLSKADLLVPSGKKK